MKRQTKLQAFIDTATPEDWNRLSAHIKAAPTKRESLPAPELGFEFSYSGIAPLLEERGLLERNHQKSRIMSTEDIHDTHVPAAAAKTVDMGFPPFIIAGDAPAEKVKRSVQLDRDVSDRLFKLESSCWQYTHSAVLNQIIRDGLSKYGF